MSSDQMPAPGKIKLIKFPPPGQERMSNARGMPRGGGEDVEASIWLIHNACILVLDVEWFSSFDRLISSKTCSEALKRNSQK